ncbi:MAG: PqqD family protein [bacterium]
MLNYYIQKTSNLAFRQIEKEFVILDTEQNILHTLNEIGSLIWKMANGKTSINKIIDKIYHKYNSNKKIIEKDVIKFINELVEKKLLILKKEK